MTKRKQTIIVQFHFWPSISKIFEKVVYNQLYRYFTQNNLFSDSQYGFRPKHSTDLATVELVDRIIQSTDNKKLPLAIHMDLSKNFDGLQSCIISNATFLWHQREITLVFHQLLSQRTNYVEENGIYNPQKSYSDGSATGIHFGPSFIPDLCWMTLRQHPNTLLSFGMLMIPRYSVQCHILFQHSQMNTMF